MDTSEYRELFLSEAQEILDAVNSSLVELEKTPDDEAQLQDVFRRIHTLKSMAQTMEHTEIAQLAHSMEAALALLRTGQAKADRDTVDLLFRSLDALAMLVDGARTGKPAEVDIGPLVDRFDEMTSAAPGRKVRGRKATSDEKPTFPSSSGGVQTVRVPLATLDGLMDLVGELSISGLRLRRICQSMDDGRLMDTVEQISRQTSQIQDQIMRIRLVPLEHIFVPYPRMVRDLAVSQHKEVDLQIEGSDIGLDRSIQDEINEPLLHLLKNAVVHGIEEPRARQSAGKSSRGTIRLAARRERDDVIIELADDGRGIDVDRIKEIAVEKGFATEEELSGLTRKETMMLLTVPGLSSATKITGSAGRGVGLNAVRNKVEAFGGALDIDGRPNEGTTVSIRLPLTRAIIQTLLVGVAQETYCIPLAYVTETMRISPAETRNVEDHELISYRGTVLPLVGLREKLGFSPSPAAATRAPVVVVEVGPKRAGLVVEDLLGQQQTIVKPLTGILNAIEGVTGSTILASGKVALVLDVPSLM